MENKPNQELNELIKRRMEELQELNELDVNPYAYNFDVDSYSKSIKDNFTDGEKQNVRIAGRIMAIRRMGKASFAHIMDREGRIQFYIRKDDVGEKSYQVFKLSDIGDIVGIEGYVFKTKTGEISVHAERFELLSKSIRPIPIPKEVTDEEGNKKVFDQFTDKEARYRQRYLDLILNQDVKDVFVKRTKIISAMRRFLDNKGYLEVQTPILQPLYGGASARPFITHHNALDVDLYLRIADELYLKRLIVGGLDGVYEIGKDFRNEGIDRTHNPEFTMMELYVAFFDYEWMMTLVEDLINFICIEVFGSTKFTIEGNEVDFKGPWKRLSMYESIKEKTGIDILTAEKKELSDKVKEYGVDLKGSENKGQLIDELFEAAVQVNIIQPTFVIDYPIEISPLAKKHREKEGLVERFEGFVIGRELCNAFSELNDPIDQRERFEAQQRLIEEGDDEAHQIDEDFIRSLEYGMPPTAGLGIGVDRLVMLLTNQSSIRDVILFPHMKPEK